MNELLKTFKPQVGNENHIEILGLLKKYEKEKTPGRKTDLENRIKYLMLRTTPLSEILKKETKSLVFKKAFKKEIKKLSTSK